MPRDVILPIFLSLLECLLVPNRLSCVLSDNAIGAFPTRTPQKKNEEPLQRKKNNDTIHAPRAGLRFCNHP
ncbi:hypothetical protein EJ05DRAFT_22432 [Pseudovirgaria hyperparasitica]|uniref:Secreted protein n=1 Tax=Pseudovirgaria hyperparasitica TaxID=470096 RepID=A0A6A6WLE9_9PEZI|nr:uncharacterized protein EJ05DRAFT_22432 [Pseudovirgaria hyperparasitica]KAF2762978.1 hypothetical protein EJ05DRAFT_22432 [Pseudovirgaria hyperparasitica]